MKLKKILILLMITTISFAAASYAQDKKAEEKKKSESGETKVIDKKETIQNLEKTKVVSNKLVNTVCPVSGEEIDPKITAVYNGKTYALCCKSCLKKFTKDPEKYISKLSEDGKSLKKIN